MSRSFVAQLIRVLLALLSVWRRRPGQLAALVTGLALATGLWSGVQLINREAQQSYARSDALIDRSRLSLLVPATGGDFAQSRYIALRRAGVPVSPLVDGRVIIAGHSLRLIGIDPVTLPSDGGSLTALAAGGGASLDPARFLLAPGVALIAPESLAALGLTEGARPALDDGDLLPPLTIRADLPPGVVVLDIGFAQDLLHQPGRLSALLLPRSAASAIPDGFMLRQQEAGADLGRLTDSFHLNLSAFGFLAFLVGLFIVHSAVGLAFEQRLPTLRTLRAIGVSARLLALALAVEGLLLALVAGAAGVWLGAVIAVALLPDVAASLKSLYGAEIAAVPQLDAGWWLAGLAMALVGALAALAGSLLKAWRLPVLAPAQPFAWAVAEQRRHRIQAAVALLALLAAFGLALALVRGLLVAWGALAGFALLGLVMMAAALLLPLALALALKLGQRLARRPLAQWFWADGRLQLPGLSLALMALLLALATNIGVGAMVAGFRLTFTQWLDQRLIADLYLDGRDEPSASAIADWASHQPAVQAVLPNWHIDLSLDGQPLELFNLPDHPAYRSHWPLLAVRPDAWEQLAAGTGVMISEQLAYRFGLSLGDPLTLPATDGPWTVPVVAIYPDYGNPKGQIRAGVAALARHWPLTRHTGYNLMIAPGQAPLIAAEMTRLFAPDLARMIDQPELRRLSLAVFERTFAVTTALDALTLGVAGLALLIGLITLGGLRLPQLAPLWAIGVARRPLIALEALRILALAVMTALIAVPLGLVVSWCLVAVVNVAAFGWRLPFHLFPGQWLRLILLAALTAGLAAVPWMIRLYRLTPGQLTRVFTHER